MDSSLALLNPQIAPCTDEDDDDDDANLKEMDYDPEENCEIKL